MICQLLAWSLLLLLGSAGVRAEVPCPFLNAETAADILGSGDGKVTTAVTVTDKGKTDATCEFVLTSPKASSVLRIEVRTMKDWRKEFPAFLSQCGSHPTKVIGIGNDAIACDGTAEGGKVFEQLLSRVRERSLSVRMTSDDAHAEKGAMRSQSIEVADEVSGNLF